MATPYDPLDPLSPAPASGPARRRYLTILFSDLCDSTELAEHVEAEHYSVVLSELRNACRALIPKHGGTIVRIQGDGVLAIFGYPDAQEDDGRRAADTALALHDAVRALVFDPPLPQGRTLALHTGIHAGLVLVDEGDLVRGRFELMGTTPNIAARLSAVALRDEILVSEETLGPESHFFQTSERRLLSLKGRDAAIAAFSIRGRADVGTRFEALARRGLARYVGREAELAMLETRLGETLAGQPNLIALSAASGLGKTRLVEEFLRRATGHPCQIFRGYCENHLGAEPLQPFVQVLAALFGLDHSASVPRTAGSVGSALAEIDPSLLAHRAEFLQALSLSAADAAPAARRAAPEAVVAAICALFARLAAKRPVLLFIDDWQWADDASNQLLNAITALRLPMFVLLATRGFSAGDASMSRASIVPLAPLEDAAAAEKISQLLPGIDPFIAAEIRRYAGGNPLYIEELCHSAAHGGGAQRFGRIQQSAGWLSALVESRVARIPPAQAELVRTAAVIGNVIPTWLLESVSGCAEDHPLVRGLALHDFVFPGERPGTLRFKHGIARDVIYQTVGLHERRALHLRIAQALRQHGATGAHEESSEALAYHFGAAGQYPEAAHYAEAAGDKALAASALDRAKAQYRAALEALDQLAPSAEVYRRWTAIAQRLGLACVFDASRDELAYFERALVIARSSADEAAMARAGYWLGYVSYALGDAASAVRHGEAAWQLANRIQDEPLKVQIRATLGQARSAACEYEAATVLLDEAIGIKRRHLSGAKPAVGLAFTLATKATVLGDRGEFGAAHACFDEALAVVGLPTHEVGASIRGLRSVVYTWQGRWNEAHDCASEAYRIAERVRSLFSFSMTHAASAYAQWAHSGDAACLQALADATSWLEPRRSGLFRSLNFGWLAHALATSGRHEEARHAAARALVRARQHDYLGVAMAYRALATSAAQARDLPRARACLARADQVAERRGAPHESAANRWCEAGIEARLGHASNAMRLLDAAATAFERLDMRWHLEAVNRQRAGPKVACPGPTQPAPPAIGA